MDGLRCICNQPVQKHFAELVGHIGNNPEDNITVYDETKDEYYTVRVLCRAEDNDVLDKNHIVLVIRT